MAERSFIRSRRYSQWNAHRGGPDLERQVICQGSVLRFKINETFTREHQERIEAGLGAHREAGLGAVWLNPPLLDSVEPRFDPISETRTIPSDEKRRPDSPLIALLKDQARVQESRADVVANARRLANSYMELLCSARRLKGLEDTDPIGPSASQWGSVLAAAKARGNDLARDLFDDENGVCRLPGWRDEFFDEGETKTFAAWAGKVLVSHPDRRFAQHLAREIQDRLKKEGHR